MEKGRLLTEAILLLRNHHTSNFTYICRVKVVERFAEFLVSEKRKI